MDKTNTDTDIPRTETARCHFWEIDSRLFNLAIEAGGAIIEVMQQPVLISVVDDDVSLREALPGLLQALGFSARSFASAQEFLVSDVLADTRCLILDVSMPGMSGPQLQCELSRREIKIPIIFITALCDRNLRADLVARGAIECLFKPFSERDLCSALDRVVGAA